MQIVSYWNPRGTSYNKNYDSTLISRDLTKKDKNIKKLSSSLTNVVNVINSARSAESSTSSNPCGNKKIALKR